MPAAVGLHVYRIVEEGLTNVLRHSGARRAWVRLRAEDDVLHLTVDDNGHGLPTQSSHSGHGLVGVAERAALHGGSYELGPGPHGGCRLAASLPVSPALSDPPLATAPDASPTPPGRTPVVGA